MSGNREQTLTVNRFKEYWQHEYAGCPPISYMLRQKFTDRWFRIHTLLNSKRYAESSAEESAILQRHNSLLSSILSWGQKYVLITTGYSADAKPVRTYSEIESLVGKTDHFMSTPMHELEEDQDPNYWHFFFVERIWRTNAEDELLKLVADNTVANVLFVSLRPKAIYHRYDGGADVILDSAKAAGNLKQQFESWVSSNPHGL